MSQFTPGDRVEATEDIRFQPIHGEERILARKGQELIVRNVNPLECSPSENPLFAFDVKPDQIAKR